MLESKLNLSASFDFSNYVTIQPSTSELDNSWYLKQTRADQAQQKWSGSSDVIVAVIDTEFNLKHDDIYLNLWINPKEIPDAVFDGDCAADPTNNQVVDVDCDGTLSFYDLNDPVNFPSRIQDRDNDNKITVFDLVADPTWKAGTDESMDGAIDLVGWDADDNDANPHNENGTAHGTQVMGVIAATANNNNVVGVTPRVRILPIRVHKTFDLAQNWLAAINYLKDLKKTSGINVAAVNVSLRVNGLIEESAPEDVTFHEADNAVRQLVLEDIAYIDSAGNDGANLLNIDPQGARFDDPSSNITRWLRSPGAIVVGATAEPPPSNRQQITDIRAESNYGLSQEMTLPTAYVQHYQSPRFIHGVDILAPGENMQLLSWPNSIAPSSGTSFAAPQVAATVALIRSLVPNQIVLPMSAYASGTLMIDKTQKDRHDDGDVCQLPNMGIVEHVLCAAREFSTSEAPQHFQVVDHGFLNVQATLDRVLSIYPSGDLNLDNLVDGNDIDFFYAAVRYMNDKNQYSAFFDLNGDNVVEANTETTVSGDAHKLIVELMEIEFGDSNLDGQFTSADLVLVFGNGEYNDGDNCNSGWVEGDWNGDGDFDDDDLDFVEMIGSYEN